MVSHHTKQCYTTLHHATPRYPIPPYQYRPWVYPTREQLENDIQRGVSYVMEHEGVPCATFVFIIGDDPTYQYIEDGQWLDDTLPYGTIHRIASNGQRRGIFRTVLDWCSAQCSNIRIDTHQANARMIHLIEQADFRRCGIIYTRDSSPRIAFQKVSINSKQ